VTLAIARKPPARASRTQLGPGARRATMIVRASLIADAVGQLSVIGLLCSVTGHCREEL
jgi:hypothetical protein